MYFFTAFCCPNPPVLATLQRVHRRHPGHPRHRARATARRRDRRVPAHAARKPELARRLRRIASSARPTPIQGGGAADVHPPADGGTTSRLNGISALPVAAVMDTAHDDDPGG